MSELSIRRERIIAERFDKAAKTEKTGAAAALGKTAKTAAPAVTDGLRIQFSRMNQASRLAEGRQLLRTGEGALAEVQDSLGRMAGLAREAAQNPAADRAALQAELEKLLAKLEHVLDSASYGEIPLFGEDTGGAQLPEWLVSGLSDTASGNELLASLGLDSSATPEQILAAVRDGLGSNPAADRLAALYLGAVISGGGSAAESADLGAALDGLRQLLDQTAQGVPLDRAVAQLTNGAFGSLLDYRQQLDGGTGEELARLLSQLLSAEVMPDGTDLLAMAGLGGTELDMLLEILGNTQSAGAAAPDLLMQGAPPAPDTPENGQTDGQAQAVRQFGDIQAAGRDLAGVIYDGATGTLTVSGRENIVLSGAAPPTVEGQAQADVARLLLTGSGTVTLQDAKISDVVIDAAARLTAAGQNVLGQVQLQSGASLTLDGSGLLEMAAFKGDASNTVTLSGGMVSVDGGRGALGNEVQLVLQQPALLAAQLQTAHLPDGVQADPVAKLWSMLVPGWHSVSSLTVDGRLIADSLERAAADPAAVRLLLENRLNDSQGYPIHSVEIQGRDQADETKTRYAWLRWDQRVGRLREVVMYPNPFTVTGGVKGEDWDYEQETQTLYIHTNRVTGLSGGSGLDAAQEPFSGRVALDSHLQPVCLTLGGVSCRAPAGRAFSLGQDNEVTLFLGTASTNTFVSGQGCAGISLGDSTSLTIDREPVPEEEDLSDGAGFDPGTDAGLDAVLNAGLYDEPYDEEDEDAPDGEEPEKPAFPAGTLYAVGGFGGAGIGRDSGESRDRVSAITIRGGVISASGGEGGAGIGAGACSFMGPISITGGTVTARGGSKGGAGIGGALGALAGDITIMGGVVSALAVSNAAAIGSGLEGECGDIIISGTARIVRAEGGDEEAGIGACHPGGCGEIQISGEAEIGDAAVKRPEAEPIALQLGQDTVRLPRFVITPRMLRLKDLDITSYINAQFAEKKVEDASRHVGLIQQKYSSMYGMLDRMADRERNERGGMPLAPIRSSAAADILLAGAKNALLEQSAQPVQAHGGQAMEDILRLLK